MKKLSVITAVAGIFISQINSKAQGLYVGIGGGYGIPSQVQTFYPTYTSNGSTSTFTSQSVSYGQGVSVGIYGGYMITRNLGVELNISDKFSYNSTSTNSNSTTDFTNMTNYTAKGGLFRFTPGIRLMTGENKLKIYTVTGLIIGLPSASIEENSTSTNSSQTGSITNTDDEISTYSGGIIIGFHGAIGAIYMVSDKIGIFGEVFGDFQTWTPSQLLITTYTENGVDELGQLTTSEKQTNFVSSFTSTNSSSPGSPSQNTKVYLPFSSFGINIGVRFSFGKGSDQTPAMSTTPAK